jgi:hypothetical protein
VSSLTAFYRVETNETSLPSNEPEEEEELERLPIHSYDVMKDKELRNLLKVAGLPTDGDRSMLQERHKR